MQSRWGNHAIAFGEPTIGPAFGLKGAAAPDRA